MSEAWRDFFEDDRPSTGEGRQPPFGPSAAARPSPAIGATAPPSAPASAAPEPAEPPSQPWAEAAVADEGDRAVPLSGAAAAIALRMEESLSVPTATSVRAVPARLLEVNREIINRYLARSSGGRVSFTHLIGWAVSRPLRPCRA